MGINMGVVFTWPAFTINLFQSQNTTLNRPMTDLEISFFSGMSSIGALIATPTAGFLLDKLGRKNCSIFNSTGLAVSINFSPRQVANVDTFVRLLQAGNEYVISLKPV